MMREPYLQIQSPLTEKGHGILTIQTCIAQQIKGVGYKNARMLFRQTT